MQQITELVKEISQEGCDDIKAIEVVSDLAKKEVLRRNFTHELNRDKLSVLIDATKTMNQKQLDTYNLISRLSKRERQCYLLHVVNNQSFQQIADMIGIKKGTVQQYIERARDKMQTYLV